MSFNYLDALLDTCNQNLEVLKARDSFDEELEAVIICGMVMRIVSAYEDYLETLFKNRAEKSKDKGVVNFVTINIDQKFRTPNIAKINEMLGAFKYDTSEMGYNSPDNGEIKAAWDNLIKARHYFVHKSGSLQLTMEELNIIYPKTKKLLAMVEARLENI